MATAKAATTKVKYTGEADFRVLPQNILKDHAGVEHERLRFDRVNAIEVPQAVADWLVENDSFDVAD